MPKSFLLHALRRIRKYLTAEKANLLAKAFSNSQFSCAPLIWMFSGYYFSSAHSPRPTAPFTFLRPWPKLLFHGPHISKLLFHGPELSK